MGNKKFALITRNEETRYFSNGKNNNWLKEIIKKDAAKILFPISEENVTKIINDFYDQLVLNYQNEEKPTLSSSEWHKYMERAMQEYPELWNSFQNSDKKTQASLFEDICSEMNKIVSEGDNSNGSIDSSLTSSKRALIVDAVEKITYKNFHLNAEQRQAFEEGYIYVHDMGHRRDSINCCLFDMESVLSGGFEMGEMWYNEPSTLNEAFDVIANITINGSAQIYGGFTIPQIDEILSKYAQKSFNKYMDDFVDSGIAKKKAEELADIRIGEDFYNGFVLLERRFNSVISPRGDYPFITITFGLGTDKYSQMAVRMALKVRKEGHGKEGFKRPVLFPKLVFLYDKNLHGKNKKLNALFTDAIECSSKVMYPEYLSLTGKHGIVSEVYKKYGKVISPMCCRAFLSTWFERGGEAQLDDKDEPVFIGRFNIGVVSLNLPMLLAKSMEEKTNFYSVLDHYLNLARQIHIMTYKFLANKEAHTNPLAFMLGGLYGGHLKRDDKIEPLLKSATASFGITALNELQRLYNGKSLVEDGCFALETVKYINKVVMAFQKEDKIQYSVYGTPAESLCGRQAKSFRNKYGVIKNVSDREYFSNSFHCHVSEDITPIEKQDLEARFWDWVNGGKIQYVRIDEPSNIQALKTIVLHAMELGLYEGINISLAYCENCGYQWNNIGNARPEICPRCHKSEMTLIDRMCGYIAFTKIHGKSRLNEAKMKEVEDRISM